MTQATEGYVADIGYTYGYYSELNPVHARFALLAAGIAPPAKVDNACELGFGQGVSLNMHAATQKTRWWGNDFLPQQVEFAQGLATAAGSNLSVSAESFDDFCHRADLPDMDFIGLHGVWTWVNDASRKTIVDFIRRKLKPGGVVYASYNTQPGWANVIPVRELFMEYADAVGGPQQSTSQRIDTAIGFTQKLLAANPRFLAGNQQAQQQLRHLLSQDKHYLAHEYFNADWEPMSFAKFSKWLEPLGLAFACPGNMLEHVDGLYMTGDQMALVQAVPDARVRQSVRDFVLNANFRRDYWVRDAKRLEGDEHSKELGKQLVVLARPMQEIVFKVGDARLNEAIYGPIVLALADLKPKSIAELAGEMQARGVAFEQLMQALVVLVGKYDVLPAQPAAQATPEPAQRLNQHIMKMAKTHGHMEYLASPVVGGGLLVRHDDQLLLPDRKYAEPRVDVYRALGVV